MILTGKAKECFLEWYGEPETYFYRLNTTCQHANIIEWLDSVGIWDRVFYEVYIESTPTTEFKYITRKAIIKANEIYNKR